MTDHDIPLIKHFVTYCLYYTFSSVYSYMYKYRKWLRVHSKQFSQSKRQVFKFLQSYHQFFVVFHCLGCWNELASDWYQLFKVFSKEFIFLCYFWKMNDLNHAFGTSSWNKNSGSLLTFEHLKTQQLVVFKHSVFFTMYFSLMIHTF